MRRRFDRCFFFGWSLVLFDRGFFLVRKILERFRRRIAVVDRELALLHPGFAHERIRIERAFERAPILQEFRKRPAGTMSGGQQRLLEIERALLADPALVLVDEPTVGIDPKRAGQIYEHLRALVSEEKRTVLMVDQNVIAGIGVADYIYVLELGANRLEGSRAEFDANYRDTIADWLI